MEGNFEMLRAEYRDTLQKAFQAKNVDLVERKVKSISKSESDSKTPLDQTLRDMLLSLLEDEVDVAILKDFVDFSISLCRRGISSPTIPVVLLGDIFETLTLDTCECMFSFVEDNVNVWKEELFFTGSKNILLRLCNDLLRRLSRTTATVFCGKILLFLAKFFPFSERSGLNIVSEFNLENVTEYVTDTTDDIVTEISTGEQKHMIDFTFYRKFWELQDFFRNPNQCYTKVQWKLFSSHATSILNTFHGIKLDYVTASDDLKNVGYFAKYLTSQKLLDLQLHDVNFRRSVLLQFLIVFQYFTSAVKFKSDSYELKSDQKEWICNNTEKVYNLLRETPPDGEEFALIVKNILGREELWNSWKNDSCPEMKKSVSSLTDNESEKPPKKQLLGDMIKEAHQQGKFYIGNGELTRLWNQCPGNLDACKGRDFLPTLDEYFAEAVEQLEAGAASGDDSLLKDGNFGWRALRLLARRSPHFFTYGAVVQHPLAAYLEATVRRVAQERPGKGGEGVPAEDGELDDGILAAEELKQTESEELGDEDGVGGGDKPPSRRQEHSKSLTLPQLNLFSEKVAPQWEKLAVKLGYKQDEIDFFRAENPTAMEQARNMLQLWFEDDEDATLENFIYILEGLDMPEAAEAVRQELASAMEVH